MVFVFDTNTLISALIKPKGIPSTALARAIEKGKLIFSVDTATEYLEVASRIKFNKYMPMSFRTDSARQLIGQSESKFVIAKLPDACRDIDDIKFLELALEARATAIVSGDKDLLTLHPFRGIPIVSPTDFLKMF
ncbi:MAG: putative toxin-antitoxin system toxin component, PIN family [Cyclobacteriaceae bacterium]|jgi:putative PIN family toxin of toxin-antitoxin system